MTVIIDRSMEILVAVNRWHRRVFGRLKIRLRSKLAYFKMVVYSLFYNEFVDVYYVADTCMEPLFWIVDRFTQAMGPIFVATITIVGCTIIGIAYTIGFSYWWHRDGYVLALAFVIGHWLLVNIVFHYWMALTTNPGMPPEVTVPSQAVTVCKKCVAPKPPRTHHCSVCNRCVLKMDHHCPWLNNCVGHFTHRYFFMFCFYVLLGIVYLMAFGYGIVYDEYFGSSVEADTIGVHDRFQPPTAAHAVEDLTEGPRRSRLASTRRYCVTFTALVCVGVFFALGALTAWHARLITLGETSIEAHINKKERLRLAKEGIVYRNPYDFGPTMNWKNFLGLVEGRSWRHLLFPSRHPPEGDGLVWAMVDQ